MFTFSSAAESFDTHRSDPQKKSLSKRRKQRVCVRILKRSLNGRENEEV